MAGMGGLLRRRLIVWLVAAAACLALPGVAAAQPSYAPLNQPGPALTPGLAKLKASLTCESTVKDAKVEPVLLNPGTSTTATENFGWNWEPALQKLGIPYCAYNPPEQALGPIDISGEYLVYAIRTEFAMAGRRIAIIGHSQGGMSMRWALRFWPDTRQMVADVVGLEPDNDGTTVVTDQDCSTLGCAAGDWDQTYQSPFIQALNSGTETFAGISYTNTYSVDDELVHPDSGPGNCSSCLSTGKGQISNVELQSVCPLDTSEHVEGGTTDPVPYALGIDAITHPGPADAARVPRSVCDELLMPGVTSPQSAQAGLTLLEPGLGSLGILPGPATNPVSGAPVLHSAPPLPCYVFADCPASVPLKVKVTPRSATAHRRVHLSVLVTATVSGITLPVPQATVRIGKGHTVTTNNKGRATASPTLGKSGRLRVTAADREYRDGHATIRVRKPAG
jgi:triacylglycerol esterase/lipase EstA (alpha/beta hydrolase family)